MKPRYPLVIVAAAAAILAIPAEAKGDFNLATVAGPDIYGELEIRDPEILASMDMHTFFEPERLVEPPSGLGQGYLITRGYEIDGERHLFDRLFYFPGSPGYVYYLETVNGSGPMDGNWYLVTDEGARAVSEALGAGGGLSKTTIAVEPPGLEAITLMIGGAALAFAGALAGYGLRAFRQRRLSPNLT